MLAFFEKWYGKGKRGLVKRSKNYVLKKFVKSDYLRETTSLIPLSLITIVTKNLFNFLVTYRLKTDVYWIDFLFSICTTVGFSLSSPFFYHLTEYFVGEDVDRLSKYCLDSLWKDGWVFFEYWKTRILGGIAITTIIVLQFVEIDSRYCQETIIHLMITSAILDSINNYNLSRKITGTKVLLKNIPEVNGREETDKKDDRDDRENEEKKEEEETKVVLHEDYNDMLESYIQTDFNRSFKIQPFPSNFPVPSNFPIPSNFPVPPLSFVPSNERILERQIKYVGEDSNVTRNEMLEIREDYGD